MLLTDRKTQRNLDKASTTTRNTTRLRTPKGLAQDLRYRVLKGMSPKRLDFMLEKRFKAMSGRQRSDVEAELKNLSHDGRREFVLRLLSRSPGGVSG